MSISPLALRTPSPSSQPVAASERPAAAPQTVDVYAPAVQMAARPPQPMKLDVDAGQLVDNVRGFMTKLPSKIGLALAGPVIAAVGALLSEGRVAYARNPQYVPMSFVATSDKIDRVKKAGDVEGGLEREHLAVPLANFGVVTEGRLYRGAQPSRAGLAWLAQSGVKTVVTLRRHEVEDLYGYVDFTSSQESEECRRAGMRLVEIPIGDETVPTAADVEKFLSVMADPASGPVYVHCAAGAGRTGVMCGIYERLQGASMARVKKDLVAYYMNPKSDAGEAQLDFVRSWPVADKQPEWICVS